MLAVSDRTKYCLGSLVGLLEISQELLLGYWRGLQVILVQELPGSELLGSELPYCHSPVLELDLPGLAHELTGLEQPDS